MPEAVIVSAARSPIGRANKGSLKDFRPRRPDGARRPGPRWTVPGLDPQAAIEASFLGCGLPGGEVRQQHGPRGHHAAPRPRRGPGRDGHPLLLVVGPDDPDGLPRHQGRRGRHLRLGRRRDRVPLRQGNLRPHPRHPQPPLFEEAGARTDEYAAGGKDWHDPREDGQLPDIYIAMGQTAENVARLRGLDRKELDEFAVRSQNLAEKAIADGFWEREITPVTTPDGTVVTRGRRAARRGDVRRHRRPRPGLPPRRRGHRRQLLRPQRRRRGGRGHVRHEGGRARPDAAGPDRVHRRLRPLSRDHGPRPGGGDEERAALRRHVHRRHRPGRDQRGVRRPGGAVVPGPRHRPGTPQRQRRRDRGRPPRSA